MSVALALPEPDLPALALEIHQRLCGAYGCPVPYFGARDPLSQLVSSVLSQRTTNLAKSIAFKSLRATFPTWEEVRDAPVDAVQEAITACTWPEQKAPRIQAMLCEITARVGKLDLSFLADMTPDVARSWLEQLNGVGPKTSAAVVSFSALRMRALPVDTHHYRVAVRTGLIGAGVSQAKAHVLLEALLPAHFTPQDYYDHHEVMMFHGQRCCHFQVPKCERCPLASLCPTGALRLSAG